MVDEVVKQEGHLDVLVNNFGISNPQNMGMLPAPKLLELKERGSSSKFN